MTQRFSPACLLFPFLLLTAFSQATQAQSVLIRKPGEPPVHFAQRLLPPGMKLVYPVREFTLGSSRHSLILLFGETSGISYASYEGGWVLMPLPSMRGQYLKYLLPSTDQINLSAVASPSFRVKSVFSAPLRRGAAPSLLILYTVRGFGAVKDDQTRSYEQEYVTEACRWTGKAFAFDPLGDRFAGLATEKAIRHRLSALPARRFQHR